MPDDVKTDAVVTDKPAEVTTLDKLKADTSTLVADGLDAAHEGLRQLHGMADSMVSIEDQVLAGVKAALVHIEANFSAKK